MEFVIKDCTIHGATPFVVMKVSNLRVSFIEQTVIEMCAQCLQERIDRAVKEQKQKK